MHTRSVRISSSRPTSVYAAATNSATLPALKRQSVHRAILSSARHISSSRSLPWSRVVQMSRNGLLHRSTTNDVNMKLSTSPAAHVASTTLIMQRTFSLSNIPTVLLPPVVFTGLLITLWIYKCLMMIIFQNRIIYMPSMPPFSRSEKIETYERECLPVKWTEHSIKPTDGTLLALLEGQIPGHQTGNTKLLILYFQGNGSSTPPRLPELSRIIVQAQKRCPHTSIRLIALSYRGFWKSRGRPSQKGIEMDAQALLAWAASQSAEDANVVLWGQSIGAGVATTALASWMQHSPRRMRIQGLLLETPFTGLRSMLLALYPQRFLPYRYLGPFLMSHWDSVVALEKIGESQNEKTGTLKCLLLEAGSDELVPTGEAEKLLRVCQAGNIEARHEVVAGAFHTNVMSKPAGRRQIVDFLESIAKDNSEAS